MERRLHIVSVFLGLNIGGDENRMLSFARALDRRRFDLSVVTIYRPDERSDEQLGTLRAQFSEAGVEVSDLGEGEVDLGDTVSEERPHRIGLVRQLGKGSRLARRVWRLTRFLRQRQAEVVDTHMGAAILYGALAGRLAGVRGVIATEYGISAWDRPYYRALAPWVFGIVDALVCDSRAKSEEMRRWLGIPHLRCPVVPNGVFIPTTTRTRGEMRRAFGLPEDPRVRVIGQISRLVPFKGHWLLLAAARRVLDREPDTAFLICGFERDPAYRDGLLQEADALGIAERVRIVKYPGPIGDVWAAIDLHVHASLVDSSPIAIAEGMALARPAVVTSVGGIPEIVEDGLTGLVIRPNDPDALADALLRLLRDPETARRLGESARERYQDRHRPEAMARALEGLFISVANGSGRPGTS